MEVNILPIITYQTISTIKIKWNRIENCDVYKLERKVKDWKTVYWGCNEIFTVENLEENYCYKFRLSAIKFNGEEYICFGNSVIFQGCTLPDSPTTLSLHRIVKKSEENILRRYLEVKPCLVNIPGSKGLTSLAVATIIGDKSIVNLLLSANADVNLGCPSSQRTPLHLAMFQGHNEIAKLLIVKRADTTKRDCIGMNYGHYAIDGGHLDSLKFCVDNGVDIESRDDCGWTFLLRAIAIKAGIQFVKYLIEHNSQITVVDKNKLSCIEHAELSEQLDIMELLHKVASRKKK